MYVYFINVYILILCESLDFLSFRSRTAFNMLGGSIPTQMADLTDLSILDFSTYKK